MLLAYVVEVHASVRAGEHDRGAGGTPARERVAAVVCVHEHLQLVLVFVRYRQRQLVARVVLPVGEHVEQAAVLVARPVVEAPREGAARLQHRRRTHAGVPVRGHHDGPGALSVAAGRGVSGARLRLRVRALHGLEVHVVLVLEHRRPVVHEVRRAQVRRAVVVMELEPDVDAEDVRLRHELRRRLVREERRAVLALVLQPGEQLRYGQLVPHDDRIVDEDAEEGLAAGAVLELEEAARPAHAREAGAEEALVAAHLVREDRALEPVARHVHLHDRAAHALHLSEELSGDDVARRGLAEVEPHGVAVEDLLDVGALLVDHGNLRLHLPGADASCEKGAEFMLLQR